jgi:hypothetical protein
MAITINIKDIKGTEVVLSKKDRANYAGSRKTNNSGRFQLIEWLASQDIRN